MKTDAKKTGMLILRMLLVLVLVVIVVPIGLGFLSLIGRIDPESVIPENFSAYVHVPHAIDATEKLLAHETLSDILGDPSFAGVAPLMVTLRDSVFPLNRFVRLACGGSLDAGVYKDGHFVASWDTGVLSRFLRLVPAAAGRISVPGLYYVQAGKNSRFEYRGDPQDSAREKALGGTVSHTQPVLYIGFLKNLLIISDDAAMYESVISMADQDTQSPEVEERVFRTDKYDIGVLLSSRSILELAGSDPALAPLLSKLNFSGLAEVALSILPRQIDMTIDVGVASSEAQISNLLLRDSPVPGILSRLPENTQYATMLCAGTLQDLLGAAGSFSPASIDAMVADADQNTRRFLDVSVEDLLFSWTGDEFAVFGLEGRPKPVFMIEVVDETKRKFIFDKLFSSFAVSEDTSVVLDGIRIPRITIPGFLERVLALFKITVPSPYYMVEDGYLFLSESPENIGSVISSMRKNESMLRTDTWRTLSSSGSARSSVSVFYSLDRTLPFFLKGRTGIHRALQMYRQGLLRVRTDTDSSGSRIVISLSGIAGSGKGVIPVPGFPVETGGRVSREVLAIRYPKRGDSRIAVVLDQNRISSVDPATGNDWSFEERSELWFVTAEGLSPSTPLEASFWAVTQDGSVYLLNGNLEIVEGFPVPTGVRPATTPAAFDGKLWIVDANQTLVSVMPSGTIESVSLPFTGQLRSPPSFIFSGKTALMALYPKSFFGQIWQTTLDGLPRAGWPVDISGIAFGSPLLIAAQQSVQTVFITQAGALTVHDAAGDLLPGFPLQLPGVFYIQPVFDGTCLWALSSDGVLYRVELSGAMYYQEIPGFQAEEGAIICADIDRDSVSEVFVSGDGNALYGFTRNFTMLAGFPLPVWGKPFFGDLNGDGIAECTGAGMDNMLYSWQFR